MAKCVNCGENNNDKSQFCSQCGKPLEKEAPVSQELNLDKARKDFEKDREISLDRSKITFVCELCGTVNRIDSPRCVRCGKPRPRSEFVNSLKRIKEAEVVQEDFKREEAEKEAAAAVQQPIKEDNGIVYRYQPQSVQNSSVVQPFVIVPYVNAAQPLWQYNPDQPLVSRYNGDLESLSELQRLNKLKEEKEREQMLQNQLAADKALNGEPVACETVNEDVLPVKLKKNMKTTSIFSLIFSIIAICALGAFVYFSLDLFKDLFNDLNNWKLYIIPAGCLILLAISLFIAIRSIKRLKVGVNKSKGVFTSILMIVANLVILFGAMVNGDNFKLNMDGIKNAFVHFDSIILGGLNPSSYVFAGASLALFIVALFTKKVKLSKKVNNED